MNQEQALLDLARGSAQAACKSLEATTVIGNVSRLADDSSSSVGLVFPLVVCHSEYAEGAAGGTLLALSQEAARALQPAPGESLDIDALAPVLTQMLEQATTATTDITGASLDVVEPRIELCDDEAAFAAAYHASTYTTIVDGTIAGHPFRFVQAVPHSLVVQLTAALEQLDVEHVDLTAQQVGERIGMKALHDVPMRCSIELGSTVLPVQSAGRLRSGEVVPLDQQDTDPLVLRLSGRPYALGYLRPTPSGELEFEITEIIR